MLETAAKMTKLLLWYVYRAELIILPFASKIKLVAGNLLPNPQKGSDQIVCLMYLWVVSSKSALTLMETYYNDSV